MKKFFSIISVLLISLLLWACSNESLQEIVSIETLETIQVERNVAFDRARLPQTIRLTLSNGETFIVEVLWQEHIDTSVVGVFTLTGELVLPSNLTNPSNIQPSVVIEVTESTLLEYLENNDQYSIFFELINVTELDVILALEGPFTVFVPTDESFEVLFALLGVSKEVFFERDDLADIVLYHVITDSYNANRLVGIMPGSLNTLANQSITFSLTGPRITLNNFANVTTMNITVSNGVIHEVNQVLFPPSTIDSMFGDLISQELIDQITAILLQSISLPDLLSGNVSITVFLPSQEALLNLATELELTPQELIEESYFVDILTYHIVLGRYFQSDLVEIAPGTLNSLNGESLTIAFEETLTINHFTILSTELLMDLIIIHFIDGVLMPSSIDLFN